MSSSYRGIGAFLAIFGATWFSFSLLAWIRYLSLLPTTYTSEFPKVFLRYGALFGLGIAFFGIVLILWGIQDSINELKR